MAPAKAYKVCGRTDTEYTSRACETSRVGRGHLHGIAEAEARVGGDVSDGSIERGGRAGEIHAAGNIEAAIWVKVDFPTNWRRILAGREPCKRHDIRNQNGASRCLGAQHCSERVGWKMSAIRNEGRCQPVLSQLRPDEIRMAGQHVRHAIAEMSRKARARIDSRANLICARAGMTERNMDAARSNRTDVFWRLRVMWRERYYADEIVAGCLPAR